MDFFDPNILFPAETAVMSDLYLLFQVPSAALAGLLEDKDALTAVLARHVIAGANIMVGYSLQIIAMTLTFLLPGW